MGVTEKNIKTFNTQRSLRKAEKTRPEAKGWELFLEEEIYTWGNPMERVNLAREGILYDSLEIISEKLNTSVKFVLSLINMPQTTYNKKKKEGSLLDSRNSELVLLITEMLDYGLEVFNDEEGKFQRWLKKPNISLGGNSPETMLDTVSGINEVRSCLDRIEYGNFA